MVSPKTLLKVMLFASALIGCAPSAPSISVEIQGAPDAIKAFVDAERTRKPDLKVSHGEGMDHAVFELTSRDEGYEISKRAIESRLSVESQSQG